MLNVVPNPRVYARKQNFTQSVHLWSINKPWDRDFEQDRDMKRGSCIEPELLPQSYQCLNRETDKIGGRWQRCAQYLAKLYHGEIKRIYCSYGSACPLTLWLSFITSLKLSMEKPSCPMNKILPVHAPPRCSSWVCGCGDIGISAS